MKKKCGDYSSFIDLFSGTGVVANSFNSDKVKIITNDLLYSNYVIAKSFFETTKSPVGILKKIELGKKPNLDVILGVQSTSGDDYSNQLLDKQYFNIRHHTCNLASPKEILEFLNI